MKRKFNFNKENLVNLLALIAILFFILIYIDPKYILSKSTTSGGDMGSDFYPAYYLKTELLPKLKLVGWAPGWYGGIPMFQFYFLPAFFLMSILSYIIPLEISFKIVTLLGTFLLPIATYFSFKLMKFKFPTPVVAAILTLPFLFMEANSMWGGNIPSTLAGEFSHSFGLAFSILFLGVFYKGFNENKGWVKSSLLFSLVALSHVYTAFFALFSSSFLFIKGVFEKNKFKKATLYFFKTYFLAFLFVSFWAIPFALNMAYTTPYKDTWKVDLKKVLPTPINYFAILTSFTLVLGILKKDNRIMFLGYSIVISLFFFLIAEHINLINIRFIPFVQLFIMIIPACLFDDDLFSEIKPLKKIISSLKHWTIPLIILLLTIYFVQGNVTFIKHWVKWNYEGFENKNLWKDFKGVNDFVSGDQSDPRVVYEHSDKYNSYGTTRAFEMLPYFSGRSTLEGLFMQSSISSPFVFYIQSEIGEQSSCPFWNIYKCTTFNLTTGTKHLEMFNVNNFIITSDKVKNEIKNFSEYKFLEKIGDIEIYELTTNKNHYVIVPEFQPVIYQGKEWKSFFYEWFKDYDLVDVPIIKTKDNIEGIQAIENLSDIQKIPFEQKDCVINEIVSNEEIKFTTNCPYKPHIIRISYHPNWKVEGADKVYLVSPSLMLVFPEQEEVRMWYGTSWIDVAGYALTISGIIFLIAYILFSNHKVIKFLRR